MTQKNIILTGISLLLIAVAGVNIVKNSGFFHTPRGLSWDADTVLAERLLPEMSSGDHLLLIQPFPPLRGTQEESSEKALLKLWKNNNIPVDVAYVYEQPRPPAPPKYGPLSKSEFQEILARHPHTQYIFSRVNMSTATALSLRESGAPEAILILSANFADSTLCNPEALRQAGIVENTVVMRIPSDLSINRAKASDDDLFDSLYEIR
ncbi:hypothetical protein P3T73_17560 [Kiritimatiellota bacterium B12222]|nr:hypothetical protein P3T73_17560 [Kiritimatiellota bacterium B12222]